MNPLAVIATLDAAGVKLWCPSYGRLRFRAPIGAYTADLRALVDQHRTELLFCLCWHCGSTTYRDIAIHEGASVRRDCSKCGRFIGFPVWKLQDLLADHHSGSETTQT
jgi:hypothetical protein